MDNIAQQLSNVSIYDVKASFRKAQNAVLNFSDMEAKVREATNNEPWGTPTSVMQQIADGTNNYQQFHEIMPFVYRRFTEKSAHSWRQIYKALQLLDYLVKNGSERVVDYSRSHIAVIELLRHFSYIDSKGVDQGESIRKRSEELVKLLNSTEVLRAERKKAKQLNSKTGVSSSSWSRGNPSFNAGGFGGSGKKYGGISSDTYKSMKYGSSGANQVFGDGGGFDGSNHIVANSEYDNDDFEEYVVETNVDDRKKNKSEPKKEPQPQEEEDDDDFADFQSAPPPTKTTANADILDLFSAPTPATPSTTTSTYTQTTASFSFQPTPQQTDNVLQSSVQPPTKVQPPSAQPAPKVDLFDSLWESSKTIDFTTVSTPVAPITPVTPAAPAASATQKSSDLPPTSTQPPAPQPGATAGDIVDLLSF